MFYRSFVKKINETLKRTEKLFSAAKYEEYFYTGYRISEEYMKGYDRSVSALTEEVVNACLNNTGWYLEMLHGRIAYNRYASQYPDIHKRYLELIYRISKLEGSACILSTEYLQMIRNQALIRMWSKFRKAYVFDTELANDLTGMNSEVDIPLCLPDKLPFPVVYFEFPRDIATFKSYSGVFFSVQKAYGIKRLTTENIKTINSLIAEYKNNGLIQTDENIYRWLKKQLSYNTIDHDRAKSDDYISLHMLFIGNNVDTTGFNESFTYTGAFSVGENGMCHVDKKDVYEKVCRDDFEDKENLTEIIMFILNALMYLGARNADITTRKTPGVQKLKPQSKNKKRKLEFEDTDVELNSCGFMYGATVRAFKESQTRGRSDNGNDRDEDGKRRPMRPHPVRAHYQHYHTGKGRQDIIWILKSAYYNYGSIGTEAEPITNVSRVEKG